MSEFTPRAVCYRCRKPQTLCICASVPSVDNRTGVYVLQHPRERNHSIGTARFAQLGLRNVRVEIAWNAGDVEATRPAWLPEGAALLYPRPDALDLRDLPAAQHPKHLVVLDGTWHTARTLYRDKQWLHALPHVRFTPDAPSRYRLRKEPAADYVSTIEAIVEALRFIEPETAGLDALLGAFDAMIDAQLEHVGKRAGRPKNSKRPLAHRKLPRALTDALDQLVVVYVETLRQRDDLPRELVQVAAVSLATGELFERMVQPTQGAPTPESLCYMRLAPSDFDAGIPAATLRQELQAFLSRCGKTQLAAWNQSTLDLVARALGAPASKISLKSAYRGLHGCGEHGLDEVMVKEGLDPAPLPLRGRAAIRLARAAAVARHLGERASVTVPLTAAQTESPAPAPAER
jgi:DTW domain-containing protein